MGIHKISYYLKSTAIYITPKIFFEKSLSSVLKNIDHYDKKYILKRVNYYNQVNYKFDPDETFQTISEFRKNKKKTYFFDLYKYFKYFNKNIKIRSLFGDVIDLQDKPTLLKSRPICDGNKNSVLMKLNEVRHFVFVKDTKDFKNKKDMLVWRGGVHQPHRKNFIQQFYLHPLCNVGQTNRSNENLPWKKPKMTIKEQLNYKFILSIEGNDVATNLKWIMSSNSLVFMTKPKYETWFMEATLIPNYHYVLLKDDYSDLEEKILYFKKNTDEALQIIANANMYIKQFQCKKSEDIISLLILLKYFKFSHQMEDYEYLY